MKKFSCLILSGCGARAVEDVGVVEPETSVVTEELDASVYTGKSFTIDSKSCYIDVSYDGFNMVVGSKDSVAYMKTSVEDLSSAFWFDYNTEGD